MRFWRSGIERNAKSRQGFLIDLAADIANNQAARSLYQFFCLLSVSSRM
jgi:hypothetical protein